MDRFDCFTPEALDFLAALKATNTKEWFAANKPTYEAHIKGPAAQFATELATAISALTGHSHTSKLFRIHRDVRFSKDKTPYNAHIHIALTPEDTALQPPMWFWGLSPERLSLGCGVFQYDKAALKTFRTAMAGDKGDALMTLTAKLRDAGMRIGEPDLKRVPSGFDKDHPNQDMLRRKGYAAWIDEADPKTVTQPDLVTRTVEAMRPLLPVYTLLSALA